MEAAWFFGSIWLVLGCAGGVYAHIRRTIIENRAEREREMMVIRRRFE